METSHKKLKICLLGAVENEGADTKKEINGYFGITENGISGLF